MIPSKLTLLGLSDEPVSLETKMNREEFINPRDMDEVTAESDPRRREMRRSTITTYRKEERLNEGDPVPDLSLERLEETGSVGLSHLGSRPAVLIFGSYT